MSLLPALAPPRAALHVVALLGLLLASPAGAVRAQTPADAQAHADAHAPAHAQTPADAHTPVHAHTPGDAHAPGDVTIHAAAPRLMSGRLPRVSAVRLGASRASSAAPAAGWTAPAAGHADARPPRHGVLDPLGSPAHREHPGERDRARDSGGREPVSFGWDTAVWDLDALLAALEAPTRDAELERSAATETPESQRLAPRLPRDVVRCLEPGLHRRRADARPRLLLDLDRSPASRPRTTWSVREEIHAPGSKALRGVYQVRLLDVRIAGRDLALHWSAGSSVDGVRPVSGSPVSTDTTGGTEIIELSFGDPAGGTISSFVRGRRQPEDAYASAFGRGIEGTAGVQYSPGGRWDWRLQAQQQFVNHVTEPIQAMEFSLWARLRF